MIGVSWLLRLFAWLSAKRFLSGAINPADSRWCNAQLDASTLTPTKGIGPGGSVQLPAQLAAKGMLIVAFAQPGLLAFYSKNDVSEAFRLIWLAIEMYGLFASSIPRWVLGLGLGQFYCVLLALSFGSTISPGFFDYFSKAIAMAHSSFAPPEPHRNAALAFISFVLVDGAVLMGVREGLCLLWSVMVCHWPMRMVLGVFSVNEDTGQEEAPWELGGLIRRSSGASGTARLLSTSTHSRFGSAWLLSSARRGVIFFSTSLPTGAAASRAQTGAHHRHNRSPPASFQAAV